ncbi:MAG: glycosyltransferase family 39 protein [Deltaproteobacteria bacterium]|nr:glycosyltransferase family 39 protein [Deltaproteobacteria bacterium]
MEQFTKKEWLLLVLFLVLVTFPLQYICRGLDMSTLTSWRWVFAEINPAKVFGFLLVTALVAVPLSIPDLPEKYPLSFLYVSSFLICLPFLHTPEALLDASRYFLQAKYLARHGMADFFREWGMAINPWTDLPLVPFIYGVLFSLFGESKTVIAVFNALLFSGVPLLTCLTGSLLWDRSTGFMAGLLVLASPYLLTQVPLMLVDVHTMFFMLLSVCTFLYAVERGGGLRLSAAAAAIVLALFSKYSTWPMLGVLGIIVLIRLKADPAAVLRRSLVVAAMACCLLLVVFSWKGGVILEQLQFLRTYQVEGLKRWEEGYLAAVLFQTHPFVLLAALYGIYRLVRNRDITCLIPGWFVLLVLLLGLKRVRYLMPLLPFVAITGAYGLQAINFSQVRRYVAYSSIGSALLVALLVFKPFLAGTGMANIRDAGRFLDTLPGDSVEVYCLPQTRSLGNTAVVVPILDLYTRKAVYQEQDWNSAAGHAKAQNASLRFTWELVQPDYYQNRPDSSEQFPLVIIAPNAVTELPPLLAEEYPAYRLLQQFNKTTGVYRYQTFVSVFASP